MYRFSGRNTELIVEANRLALAGLAELQLQRSDVSEQFASPFIAREILRLHREGEDDPEKLARAAIGLLRDHIQTRESALRLARPAETPKH